jgi:sarcosine oxidase
MAEQVEYVVLGLGALGSATAYHLARRGAQVVGLEQFALGHERGASHDPSRILRHSYHTPGYVRLTFDAYDDWAHLGADAGEELTTVVGGLDLFPPGAAIPAVDYVDSMRECGVDFEVLEAADVAQRWPAFRLPPDTTALYQRRAAIVPAARGTAALQRLATSYGAVLRDESPVTAVRDLGPSGHRSVHRGDDVPMPPVGRLRGRLDEQRAERTGLAAAADRDARAGHLLRATRAGCLRAGTDAAVDLDGRPVLLRLPCYGEATVKAAKTAAAPSWTLTRGRSTPTPGGWRCSPVSCRGPFRAPVGRAVQDLPLHTAA